MPALAHREVPHPLSWRSWPFRAVAILLIAMLALRLVWGRHVDRIVREREIALRAAGIPVLPEEVKIPTADDANNAWLLQKEAGNIVAGSGVDCPSSSNFTFPASPPYGARWEKMARASEAAHAAAFTLARRARSLSGVQLRQPPVTSWSNAWRTTLPLNNARALANALGDSVLWQHREGDDREAIERSFDLLRLSSNLREDPELVSSLVATGIDALTCMRLEAIAPDLRITHDAPSTAGAASRPSDRDATPRQVRALIAELLADRGVRQAIRRSMESEAVSYRETTTEAAKHQWALRPLAYLSWLRATREVDQLRAAADAKSPAEQAALLAKGKAKSSMNVSIGTMLGLSTRLYLETDRRIISERRVAAASLAMRLFRDAHPDRWPQRLDELMPEFLPAVPDDPYLGEGKTLGYMLYAGPASGGVERPLAYFEAGPDLSAAIPATPMFGWQSPVVGGRPTRDARQYRDLSLFVAPRLPGSPSTAPSVDDDPDEPDAPRK